MWSTHFSTGAELRGVGVCTKFYRSSAGLLRQFRMVLLDIAGDLLARL